MRYDFASDNTAGICPEAWAAMDAANRTPSPPYGEDDWTGHAADRIRDLFETECEVFFVFGGTAANALSLASLCRSYHSVICHDTAHLERDECGAPEFFSNGTKILLAGGAAGKLDPVAVETVVTSRSDIHYPKPRVVSLTQATEVGTVYSPTEIGALAEVARRHDLAVQMDGARFANAAATLDEPPRAITWEAGVDVLCLGGTKNGMAAGEAVVFFRRELAHEFDYRCKQAGQLASKMRFLAAPWVGMLDDGAWLKRAGHANRMARRLTDAVRRIDGVRVLFPVEANAVFLALPHAAAASLRARGWRFYGFIGDTGHRFVCSWETTADTVDALAADIRDCCA
jgi:threonine aldolase